MSRTSVINAVLLGVVSVLAACSDAGRAATQPDRNLSTLSRNADEQTLKTRDDVQIVSATGDVTAAFAEYQTLLGDLNQNAPGEGPKDRREINWDGVKPDVTNTDAFPGNFFNVTSPRGVLFTTNGTGFRVSDQGYVDVNGAYIGEFNTFSPKKLFVAIGSTITDIQFVVAGSNTPAFVTGFGSVFSDVGRANSTTIEYFDADGNRLLKIAAPRASDARGLSFVGAKFASRIVSRVRITSGDTPIGAEVEDNVKGEGQKRDIVAMDDFIYGEPRAKAGN